MTEPTSEEEQLKQARTEARSAMAKLRETLDDLFRNEDENPEEEFDEEETDAWWADPANRRPKR